MKKSSGSLLKLLKNLILDKSLASKPFLEFSVTSAVVPKAVGRHYVNLPAYYNLFANKFSNLFFSHEKLGPLEVAGCVYIKQNNLFIFRVPSLFVFHAWRVQQYFSRFCFCYISSFNALVWRLWQKL